jgi:hypothetical protein
MKQMLEKVLAKKWMIFLLFLSLTYLFGTKTDRRYGWTNINVKEATAIYSDGAAYYAFLPEWFIYEGNNFAFNDSIGKKYPDAGFEDNLSNYEGIRFNKYFTGTAQCLTPFFLIGHTHANAVGEDTDGYSWPYLLWLNAGMIAYAMIGFISLFLFLRRLKLDYFACYTAVISLALATNLSFYIYLDIPYSHVFSFAIINLCLLQGLKWIQENKALNLLLFAFFLGLSFAIRPTNILVLSIIPFLFATNNELWNRLKVLFTRQWKALLFGVLLFGIPVLIQIYSFYLQLGEIRLNSYSGEGFSNWNDPYMWEILFGFRKGMFVYSPFLLLLFPGLALMFFKNKRLFAGVLIFGLLSVYVLSSWWCWWYGGSLGFRAMIDFYGVLVIPVAFLIHYSPGIWRVFILLFIVLTAYVYQTYEFQYRKRIIHYDYMNYPMWKKIFLKEDPRFNFVFYSKIDTLPQNSQPVSSLMGFSVKEQPLKYNRVYGGDSLVIYPNTVDFMKRLSYPNLAQSDAFAGVRVSMDLYLGKPDENVNILAKYFKAGSELGIDDMIISSRPRNIKEWEFIKVDLTSDHRWKDLDSIQCSLIIGGKTTRFKNLKIQFYKYE